MVVLQTLPILNEVCVTVWVVINQSCTHGACLSLIATFASSAVGPQLNKEAVLLFVLDCHIGFRQKTEHRCSLKCFMCLHNAP